MANTEDGNDLIPDDLLSEGVVKVYITCHVCKGVGGEFPFAKPCEWCEGTGKEAWTVPLIDLLKTAAKWRE